MDKTINNDIISLPIGKILIVRQHGNKQFYKITNENIITNLNKEERGYIRNILLNNKKDVLYFENDIDEEYKDVFEDSLTVANLPEFMKPAIKGVGSILPQAAKKDYYSKLYSLVVEEKELNGDVTGYYSPEANTIVFSKKYSKAIMAMQQSGMIKSAKMAYIGTEVHELIHFASTKQHPTGEIISRL